MIKNEKYKKKIEEIFGEYATSDYKYNEKEKIISFEMERAEFNAEKLFKLSDLLGTGTIHIRTETRNDGSCSTCSYEYGVMVLTAQNVNFN